MNVANPLWGAPRIHCELLKLGMDVGQTTVAKYMAKKTAATIARLEDVSSQSRRRCRRDRHVCGADDLVWAFHSRPTGLGAIALAERTCEEADRLDPTGMS